MRLEFPLLRDIGTNSISTKTNEAFIKQTICRPKDFQVGVIIMIFTVIPDLGATQKIG